MRWKPLSCHRFALFYASRVARVIGPPSSDGLVLALAVVALREPDATVGDAVDGADVDAVRADHFHVLGDLVRGHLVSPCGFTDCAGALGANLGECLVGLVWHRLLRPIAVPGALLRQTRGKGCYSMIPKSG